MCNGNVGRARRYQERMATDPEYAAVQRARWAAKNDRIKKKRKVIS